MHEKRDTCEIRDENGLSPTRAIYNRLKPYWKSGALHDQDWAYILVCLRRIEQKCDECKGKAVIEIQ